MKCLVIAPQPFFSPRGTPFSVYHRTRVLAETGVEIDLLTYGEGANVDIPGVTIHRIPRFASLGSVRVGPSMLKAFLDVFLFFKAFRLLLKNNYDFVDAHEEGAVFGVFLKPIFGFKLVYDMHSSLPQQLTNFGFTRSRLLIGLFRRFETACLKHSDVVVTISPALAQHALAAMADPDRHLLIENSIVDEVQLAGNTPSTDGEDKNWHHFVSGGLPVILYAGTLERYQGLDLLLEAFSKLSGSGRDCLLLVAGGSPPQVAELKELAENLSVADRCHFSGRVAQSTVREMIQAAAVVTSPRREAINTPLKIYELLASGRPFVATRNQGHTQILSDEVCYLPEPDPESLADALWRAITEPDESEKRVRSALELYEREYSREVYTSKIRQLLDRVK